MPEKTKDKEALSIRLSVRLGGLFLTLPVAIGLGLLLTVLSVVLFVIIVFGTEETGVPTNIKPILAAILGLCLMAIFVLLRASGRYGEGIYRLRMRLRGIQAENERIHRLRTPQAADGDADDFIQEYSASDQGRSNSTHSAE